MLIVGLTGGIGSGKSMAAQYFASFSVNVIDADIIARHLLDPGQAAFNAVVERYGQVVLNSERGINRQWLRDKVLFQPAGRRWLENLLHPQVRQEIQSQLERMKLSGVPPSYVIVMAPLIVETDLYSLIDRLLVIDCSVDLQVKRTCQRDHSLTPKQVEKMIAMQSSRTLRCSKADDIILNEASPEALYREVIILHEKYRAKRSPDRFA